MGGGGDKYFDTQKHDRTSWIQSTSASITLNVHKRERKEAVSGYILWKGGFRILRREAEVVRVRYNKTLFSDTPEYELGWIDTGEVLLDHQQRAKVNRRKCELKTLGCTMLRLHFQWRVSSYSPSNLGLFEKKSEAIARKNFASANSFFFNPIYPDFHLLHSRLFFIPSKLLPNLTLRQGENRQSVLLLKIKNLIYALYQFEK